MTRVGQYRLPSSSASLLDHTKTVARNTDGTSVQFRENLYPNHFESYSLPSFQSRGSNRSHLGEDVAEFNLGCNGDHIDQPVIG